MLSRYDMKKVSVIVPCYNYGWVLSETLNSVLGQTYSAWECIVVDDGSFDNTRQIAEEYSRRDCRFKYVFQPNQGISAARNTGIRESDGDYIQFLDADDLLVPTKLELQVAFLNSRPEIDLVYGDVRYFRHGSSEMLSRSFNMNDDRWMAEVEGDGPKLLTALVSGNIMVMNAPLLRSSLLISVGPFSEHIRYMEDWEFWVRCGMAGACFHYENSPLMRALVRVHPTSTSQNRIQMYKYEVVVRRSIVQTLGELKAAEALRINELKIELVNREISEVARGYIANGNIRAGIREFILLARSTRKYNYYFKTAMYWLKEKVVNPRIADKNS